MGIRHPFCGLLDRLKLTHQAQRLHNHQRSHVGQGIVQGGGSFLLADGHGFFEQHVACIKACIHLHDGDTRLGISRLNGAVNGCCTSPSRQQRGMNIQATKARRVEHPLRQDQAVGSNHHHVGLRLRNELLRSKRFIWVFAVQLQAVRLQHWQFIGQCKLLNR